MAIEQRRIRCEVCGGAGWWHKETGHPVTIRVQGKNTYERCFMCEGTGARYPVDIDKPLS